MDYGHYNCRDYYITPHLAPTTVVSQSQPAAHLPRHESFTELEARSRSPASYKPKFPLLQLPLELRQQILAYLLPYTQELGQYHLNSSRLVRVSTAQRHDGKGKPLPKSAPAVAQSRGTTAGVGGVSNIIWQRGNIALLSVCKQLHSECAELMYGQNTFLIFVTYSGVAFRFRWRLPSGLSPSRSYDFLELLPERYLRMIKRLVVHVDHVDSYTGMIKFNVGGKGLVHGLRRQIARLVQSVGPTPSGAGERSVGLTFLSIRVSNGSSALDALKSDLVRIRARVDQQSTIESGLNTSDGTIGNDHMTDDLAYLLQPFNHLAGVSTVSITGAVTPVFANTMEAKIKSTERETWDDDISVIKDADDGGMQAEVKGIRVCVYGNDI